MSHTSPASYLVWSIITAVVGTSTRFTLFPRFLIFRTAAWSLPDLSFMVVRSIQMFEVVISGNECSCTRVASPATDGLEIAGGIVVQVQAPSSAL